MRQIRAIEVLLIEVIFYLGLWLLNDYVAMYLSLIFGSICLFILLFTGIAELLERSKVSRKYFWFMAMSALAPVVATCRDCRRGAAASTLRTSVTPAG